MTISADLQVSRIMYILARKTAPARGKPSFLFHFLSTKSASKGIAIILAVGVHSRTSLLMFSHKKHCSWCYYVPSFFECIDPGQPYRHCLVQLGFWRMLVFASGNWYISNHSHNVKNTPQPQRKWSCDARLALNYSPLLLTLLQASRVCRNIHLRRHQVMLIYACIRCFFFNPYSRYTGVKLHFESAASDWEIGDQLFRIGCGVRSWSRRLCEEHDHRSSWALQQTAWDLAGCQVYLYLEHMMIYNFITSYMCIYMHICI